jgi:hypothetical protein
MTHDLTFSNGQANGGSDILRAGSHARLGYLPAEQYDALLVKIRRIHKLSMRPPNPGFAYRHLEHIHALCESLLQELDPQQQTDAAALRHRQYLPTGVPGKVKKTLTPGQQHTTDRLDRQN